MKLLLACVPWLVMGAVMVTGILWAVKGNPWLLIVAVVGFVVAVARIGCRTH